MKMKYICFVLLLGSMFICSQMNAVEANSTEFGYHVGDISSVQYAVSTEFEATSFDLPLTSGADVSEVVVHVEVYVETVVLEASASVRYRQSYTLPLPYT